MTADKNPGFGTPRNPLLGADAHAKKRDRLIAQSNKHYEKAARLAREALRHDRAFQRIGDAILRSFDHDDNTPTEGN